MIEEENLLDTEQQQNFEKRDFVQEIGELLSGDLPPSVLKEELFNYHESDIAEVVPSLTKEERLKLYKILGNEAVSEIFAYLDDVEEFIEELSASAAADIIEEMDASDAIDVLDELDEDKREEIINLMDEDAAKDIQLIDAYDEDLIGSKMSTNFVFVRDTDTIKQATKSVIEQAAENDNISTVYVVKASDETYFGATTLRDLVVARSNSSLEDITVTAYPYFYADEPVSECIEELKDLSEDSIPILSKDNKILGVITGTELVDVVDEELSDDYAKFAGLTAEEDLNEPIFKSVKKRIPWLVILMALGLIVSTVVGIFDPVITAIPLLFSFQTMIFDMSGNSGTQSLSVTIRVITAEDLTFKEKLKFIFKELRVGLINGLILCIIAFVFAALYLIVLHETPLLNGVAISGCIGLSILVAIIFSSLGGTLLPMLFKKLKIDPAVASGPMITTLNDLISAVVFYGLAYLLIIQLFGLYAIG